MIVKGNDHEIKFHEIEIFFSGDRKNDHEIEIFFRRLKFFFRRSKVSIKFANFFHEIIILTFNLMNCTCNHRSKVFKFIKLHLRLIFSPNY